MNAFDWRSAHQAIEDEPRHVRGDDNETKGHCDWQEETPLTWTLMALATMRLRRCGLAWGGSSVATNGPSISDELITSLLRAYSTLAPAAGLTRRMMSLLRSGQGTSALVAGDACLHSV